MASLIEFDFADDRLRAIDLLDEADETYQGIPRRCFLVSDSAVRLLQTQGVRFRTISGSESRKEEQHGPRP